MILSRANLRVVELTESKGLPILNNVHVEPDGTTVASNGRAILCVSPVTEETKKKITFLDNTPAPKGKPVTIAADTIKDVLRNMPADKMFGGLLEHTDLAFGVFKLTDGKRKHDIVGKLSPREYFDYREPFQKAASKKSRARVVLNRKRLIELLTTLDKACQDGTGETPVFIEFTEEGDIILRAVSLANDQRALAYMTAYKDEEGKWLEPDAWEQSITGTESKTMYGVGVVRLTSEHGVFQQPSEVGMTDGPFPTLEEALNVVPIWPKDLTHGTSNFVIVEFGGNTHRFLYVNRGGQWVAYESTKRKAAVRRAR